NGNWIISMASSSGRWDAYILGATSSGGIYFAANSYENARIITEPGNAYRVLTVGSFNSKNTWISANGQNQNQVGYTLNEITYFSSPGPTRDGRNKPDVYAPGAWISSSRSTSFTPNAYQISRDGVHYHMQGTSFAAPHLTGAVALLLEQDNNYTFEDIIDILNETKTSEGYLDIYEALFLNFENPTSPLEPSKIYSEPTLLLNRETYFFNVSPAWDRRKK
ncbi:MAG: S8 family serine peptidase, partial [Ignavibacteriaceae bacterium]|nr:S8 family serine peptidase [Ignavibacteriaceae bacterium]